MVLALALPRIHEQMTLATVQRVFGAAGAAIAPGSPLIDVTIDLSAVAPHDCPPVNRFRIAARERAWLRRIDVRHGDAVAPGDAIALYSTHPEDPLDVDSPRALRVSVAAIVNQDFWPDQE